MLNERELLVKGSGVARRLTGFKKGNPMFFYSPHPKQRVFHSDPTRVRLVHGGDQSGKTESAMVECAAFMTGYRYWLPPDDPFYKTPFEPPILVRLICMDYQVAVKGVIEQKLLKWFPSFPAGYKIHKHQTGAIEELVCPNGSQLQIITHTQIEKTQIAEGWSGHLVVIDEPCPRKGWAGSWRGLMARGGFAIFSLTPRLYDSYVAWIKNDIFRRCLENDPLYTHFNFQTQDNIGYGLTQEVYDAYASSVPPIERASRLYGRFTELTGLVYEEFSQAKHILKEKPILAEKQKRIIGLDPHPSKGHYAILHALDGQKIITYATAFGHSVPDMARELILAEPMLGDERGGNCNIFIDASYAEHGDWVVGGANITSELYNQGIHPSVYIQPAQKAPGSLMKGVLIIKNMLTADRISYAPHLSELFDQFGSLVWADKDKPAKGDDDYLDAHRLAMMEVDDFLGLPEDELGKIYKELANDEKMLYNVLSEYGL